MIQVVITKSDDKIQKIKMTGHASYREHGTDIVCAAASSIAITTVNAILRIDDSSITYFDQSGHLEIDIMRNLEVVDVLLTNMIDLLNQLEVQYPKNIKIK